MSGAPSELVVGGFSAHVFVEDLESLVLSESDAHHLFRVRRLRAGERVSAGDGAGRWRACEVEPGGAGLTAVGPVALAERPSPALTIGFALVKGERPESVVQKLTEAGIDRIIPLVTERSVVRWSGPEAGRHGVKLQRAAREAAMQSRRAWVPVVSALTSFAAVVEEFAPSGGVAMAALGGEAPSLSRPVVLVGPEGGWSPGELSVPLRRVALGEFVYRAETAAVVAGGLLAALRANLAVEPGAETGAGPGAETRAERGPGPAPHPASRP